MHDNCTVRTMVPPRSRTRHAKRLFATVFATFVAAGAMAYSTGGSQHPHQDEAPHNDTQVASNGSGGDTTLETQQGSGGGSGGGGGGGSGGGSRTIKPDAPHGAYGPGDGHDNGGSSGFMPNGENGLMTLASYAAGQGGERLEPAGQQRPYAGRQSPRRPGPGR